MAVDFLMVAKSIRYLELVIIVVDPELVYEYDSHTVST